ncbi:MAG TPA: hypothetical protein VHO70_19660 [Chitinispirillaceae bacterium]|nr:hypothetical protein [Chitinispirillaceae bacterium]
MILTLRIRKTPIIGLHSFSRPLHYMILFISLASNLYAQQFDAPIYFKKKLSTIKEVLILPVNFDCYHLTSGGIREYNYAMSSRSRKLITENVGRILSDHSFTVTTLPENSYFEKSWHPLRHFYSVVNLQILNNVYGTTPFPNAVSTFSYAIPPLPDSLLYPSTDAVLFIDGFDDCATRKREKNRGAAAALTAVSVASVVLGGPGVFVSVPSDQTAASCALVDRNGNIIWYYRYRKEGSIDMCERKDVEHFFSTLLNQLNNGSIGK